MKINFRMIIKKKIQVQKISIPELARRAGLNDMTIYNYMAGRSELTAANLAKLFDLLKIEIRRLD